MKEISDFILVPSGEARSFRVVGDTYTFLAESEDTGGAYSLFEFVIPPGGTNPPHIHNRENEIFYILEGELTFYLQESEMVLKPGGFLHSPKGVPHYFKNDGKVPVKTLTLAIPGGLEKFFEEVGYPVKDENESVPVTTEEQVKKMLEVAPKYGVEILPAPASAKM